MGTRTWDTREDTGTGMGTRVGTRTWDMGTSAHMGTRGPGHVTHMRTRGQAQGHGDTCGDQNMGHT